MYYNKNLFINERIRTQVKRLEKRQLIFIISVAVGTVALFVGALILLVAVGNEYFPVGCLIPAVGATTLAIMFTGLGITTKRIDNLRSAQTEQLKDTVYGEKYAALLQTGRKCGKLGYIIVIPAAALSLIVSLVLAIIFPDKIYFAYLGFIVPLFSVCVIDLIALSRNRKEIKKLENDLIDLFAKQYEIESAKANAQAETQNTGAPGNAAKTE